MSYGLKEYKELLEKNLDSLKSPLSVPFGMDPSSVAANSYRRNKMESINYAIEMLPESIDPDGDRYRKLRRWMSSNRKEGWTEVEQLAAIAVYLGWDDFDKALDSLPECNIGLCEILK